MNKTIALNNLRDLKKIFEQMNINYWLTDGTLLGFHREGDFIDHDLDTDIGLMAYDYSPLLVRAITLAGFKLTRVYGEFDNGLEIAFHRGGVKTDLFFFYQEGEDLVHSAWDQEPDNGSWKQIKYRYPKRAIFPVAKKSYKGERWNVPALYCSYLTIKYGDFMEVVKDWDWRFGPLNHELTEYKYQENSKVFKKIAAAANWDLLSAVTLLIKSFRRPDCLLNLVASIRSRYPDIKIQIIDDSEDAAITDRIHAAPLDVNTRVHFMPFDSGLSACRNMGVTMIKTPFFILLDDDFEFTDKTDLRKMLEIYVTSGLDILGGVIEENGRRMEYYGELDIDIVHKTLKYRKNITDHGNFKTCDLILNFFVARTVDIRRYPWDNKLKVAEHTAFFYNIKGKLKVGYTDQVEILHKPVRPMEYLEFRGRGPQFFMQWMAKKGLTLVIGFDGKEVRL